MATASDLAQRVSDTLDALQPVLDVRALWEQFERMAGTSGLLQWQNVILYTLVGMLVFAWNARGSGFGWRDVVRSLIPPQLESPAVKIDVQFFLYDLLGLRRWLLVGLSVLFSVKLMTRALRGLHLWSLPGLATASAWAQGLDPLPRSGLEFLLAALGGELAFYWYHRAAHRFPLLWQFHKVHHYSREMNPMVAVRVHDLDGMFQAQCLFLGGLLFVGLLFPLADDAHYDQSAYWVVGAYHLAMQVSSRFAHSHIPFSLGPVLDRILNTAVIHQMHHSRDIPDTNFGQSLSLWDTVFGTLHRPAPGEVIRFGVEDMRDDQYRHLLHCQVEPYLDAARLIGERLRTGLKAA